MPKWERRLSMKYVCLMDALVMGLHFSEEYLEAPVPLWPLYGRLFEW